MELAQEVFFFTDNEGEDEASGLDQENTEGGGRTLTGIGLTILLGGKMFLLPACLEVADWTGNCLEIGYPNKLFLFDGGVLV